MYNLFDTLLNMVISQHINIMRLFSKYSCLILETEVYLLLAELVAESV